MFHRKFVPAVLAVLLVLDIRDPIRLALFAKFAAVEAAAVLVVAVAVGAVAVVPSQICKFVTAIRRYVGSQRDGFWGTPQAFVTSFYVNVTNIS